MPVVKKRFNSRAKGATGERELAKYLTRKGYEASRGQQKIGGEESPDVVCKPLKGLHWEVKRVEKLDLTGALAQATRDAGDSLPVVAHRRNKEDWKITLRADDFMDFFVPGWLAMFQGVKARKADKRSIVELVEVVHGSKSFNILISSCASILTSLGYHVREPE